jgi:enediyne polyketide synthase
VLAASLAGLRWLDELGLHATSGVGHGLGEITGLVWAGSLTEPDAARLVAQRAALLATPPAERRALICVDTGGLVAARLCEETGLAVAAYNGPRCHLLAGPAAAVADLARRLAEDGIPARLLEPIQACYSPAAADRVPAMGRVVREFPFQAPSRRLISTITGRPVAGDDDIGSMLCTQLTSPVTFTAALEAALADADLLIETGPGDELSRLAADCSDVPAISLAGGRTDPEATARVAAALFTAGAVATLAPLFDGQRARRIDIWRERVFIPSPCGTAPPRGVAAADRTMPAGPADGAGAPAASHAATGDARPLGTAGEPPAGPREATPNGAPRTAAAAGQPAGADPGALPAGTVPGTPPAEAGEGAPRPGTPPSPAGPAGPPEPTGPAPQAAPQSQAAPRPQTAPQPQASPQAAPLPQNGPRHPSGSGSPDAPAGEPTAPAARPRAPQARLGEREWGIPGAGPWIRCFAEQRRPAHQPEPPAAGASWRLRGTTDLSFGKINDQIFSADPDAGTVLALAGDPAEPAACAALLGAISEAQRTGRLVVITFAAGLTGFCASLHAEQPDLGITLIRTEPTPAGLEAARRFAVATPGKFREVILDKAGAGTEPVMVATDPAADGTFPLGPADVVLVTGITRAGDLACATSLASRGAALAVIAPPGPEDPQLAACLTRLRAAGARVSRKKADLGDPGQVAAAVRSLERGLGPVTALVHGAASGPVERLATLPEQALRSFLTSQRARFANVTRAVATERLRVLVTFGSVAARYGRIGGGCDALASELLAEQAWRLAGTRPRCRVLHIDWAPWAEPERAAKPPAGTVPIPVEDGSRLLLSLLTTPDIPARVAVHGRLGVPAPLALQPGQTAPPPGRFLEMVRVHYPGVELVADTRLSVRADPYLADYRIDGVAVFPAAMVLEALAQAASALAGRPQRHLAEVFLPAPVVLPAGREESVVRVCALRVGDTVETVLRCAETGFRLDHARAVFRADGPAGHGAGPRSLSDQAPAGDGAAPGGVVDGTDLYGPVYFQAGRFRRVAFLPEASSRACRALVRGGDDQPWFGPVPGPVDAPLILGSPGLNDATLHVVQACLPHRRVLPTACESVTFSGHEVRGALRVQAARRPSEDGGAQGAWDVVATDATGQPVVTWRGVRYRDVGALARTAAWHPALLAISVEARAADFGLDPSLRALISCGTLSPPTPGALSSPAGSRGDGWADTAAGHGPLDGFALTVRAARPVACRWQAVGFPREEIVPLDAALIGLRQQLEVRSRETLAAGLARLDTIAACLAALGREPGTPLTLEDACDGGWIVVRAAEAVVACAVTEISGVPAPVAMAVASRLARAGAEGTPPPGQRGPGQPIGSAR